MAVGSKGLTAFCSIIPHTEYIHHKVFICSRRGVTRHGYRQVTTT